MGAAEARASEILVLLACTRGAGLSNLPSCTAIDAAVPPLRLVVTKTNAEGKREYIADPIEVAKIHSKPWESEWGAFHPDFDLKCLTFFRNLRKETLSKEFIFYIIKFKLIL